MTTKPSDDPHADKIPWDQKTPEQRAKAVCDHLVHEHLSGNLRPVSQEKRATTKPPVSRTNH